MPRPCRDSILRLVKDHEGDQNGQMGKKQATETWNEGREELRDHPIQGSTSNVKTSALALYKWNAFVGVKQ